MFFISFVNELRWTNHLCLSEWNLSIQFISIVSEQLITQKWSCVVFKGLYFIIGSFVYIGPLKFSTWPQNFIWEEADCRHHENWESLIILLTTLTIISFCKRQYTSIVKLLRTPTNTYINPSSTTVLLYNLQSYKYAFKINFRVAGGGVELLKPLTAIKVLNSKLKLISTIYLQTRIESTNMI